MATKTIRLSLTSLILIFGLLSCIGIAGGVVGSRMFEPAPPLRSDTNGTIVPVSQEVTVSPGTLAADIAAANGKSVFILAHETPKGITAFGVGVALTNDGVIMSTINITKENVVGVGEDGVVFPLRPIGYDELSGISFYKASDRIISPFNLSQKTALAGSSLLALHRPANNVQISVHSLNLSTTLLPPETTAPGIQKVAQLESAVLLQPGTPLLNESGELSAILYDSEKNTALFTSDIRAALERLASNRLTYNPFVSLGFTISWESELNTSRTIRIMSEVASVTNNSPADTAGLEEGDIITAMNGNTVSWDTNIVDLLQAKPLHLTIMRKEEQRTISINP